jgi:hypothetical protein
MTTNLTDDSLSILNELNRDAQPDQSDYEITDEEMDELEQAYNQAMDEAWIERQQISRWK